jgi:hypothetical protein
VYSPCITIQERDTQHLLVGLGPPRVRTPTTVGSLVTLSKYIHVTSCFEVSIATNLMVQSEFNLVLWFVSYNTF